MSYAIIILTSLLQQDSNWEIVWVFLDLGGGYTGVCNIPFKKLYVVYAFILYYKNFKRIKRVCPWTLI